MVAGGRIVKTFGTGGELYITLYDTFGDTNIEEPVFIEIDGIRTPFFFKSLRRRGQNKAVAVFEDIDSEYRAAELTGMEFSIAGGPDDEEQTEFFEGYTVRFEGFEHAGKITGYSESAFNPLFEVEYEGREVLVPDVDEYIVSVDRRKKSITFRVPEGLLELSD